jgi:hypothetical protein
VAFQREGAQGGHADADDAADNDGINDDTFVIQGNINRVLEAGQLNQNNGEQVGREEGNQEVLAGEQRRPQEVDGVEDGGGDQGRPAGGGRDAQG